MRYDIKDDEGNLVNTILADDTALLEELYPGRWEESAQQDAAPTKARRITKLAFRNRFTLAEKTALELAAIHDHGQAVNAPANLQAAAIRAQLADQRDATYIDLDRADTRAGVQALEAGGLLASGRALEILDGDIQSHEVYQ